MKKLMFIAAAALAGAAFAADITSNNIVGYNSRMTDRKKQPSLGASFLPVDGKDYYLLGSLKAENANVDDDRFQVINPTTLGTAASYAYLTKELAAAMAEEAETPEEAAEILTWVGWWDYSGEVGDPDYRRDDAQIPNGTAFLGLFESGEDIKLVAAGEAPVVTTSIETDGKKQPFIASYIPKTIKLGQIVVDNANVDDDRFQVINPITLGTTASYAYLPLAQAQAMAEEAETPEEAAEILTWVGWWDYSGEVGDPDYRRDDVDVKAGDAFLGLLESGENLVINFPSSLDEAK